MIVYSLCDLTCIYLSNILKHVNKEYTHYAYRRDVKVHIHIYYNHYMYIHTHI